MYIDDTYYHIRVFLLSIGFGFIVGFVYDFGRALHAVFFKKLKSFLIQDILFFFFSSFITFLFLLTVNGGRFRLYIFIALSFSFLLYYFTLSKILAEFWVKAADKIRKLIFFISSLISFPFRFIIRIIGKLCLKSKISLIKKPKKIKIKQKPS